MHKKLKKTITVVSLLFIGCIVSCSNEATPKIDTPKQENVSHDLKESEANQSVTDESNSSDITGVKV